MASLLLSLVAYPALIGAADTPGPGEVRLPAGPAAHLERKGDDLVIVGSVQSLFNTGFFSGPNRAQKVNRARLTPDGVTVSGGFEAIRTELALARAPKPVPGQPQVATVQAATVQVASIDPVTTGSIGDASAALLSGSAQFYAAQERKSSTLSCSSDHPRIQVSVAQIDQKIDEQVDQRHDQSDPHDRW